jgi:hypothetical protein
LLRKCALGLNNKAERDIWKSKNGRREILKEDWGKMMPQWLKKELTGCRRNFRD